MRLPSLSSIAPSILAIPVVLLACGGLAGAAQQPSSTGPVLHKPAAAAPASNKPAQDVVLAVVVRDKHGNPVPNLTADDFTLTEDGRPQTIKSFSQQSNLPLLLGLEVDTSQSVSGAINSERKVLENFVQTMLPAGPGQAKPADQAFLIHFDNEVELLEDFTSSRDKLDRELDQMGPTARGSSAVQDPQPDGGGQGGRGEGRRSADTSGHGGTQIYDAIYLASDELMKPKQGVKALIVFSDGVDRSSKETQSEAIDSAERAGTVVYTVYFRGGEQQNPFSNLGRRGGMGGGYPGGGYPGGGYPGGGYPGGGYPGGGGGHQQKAPIDGKKVMQDIANRTGGQFFEAKKTENLDEIYKQIANELHSQYVLVYTPDQPDNEGGYHKIALKPKKDDLIVTTREGYYAPGGDDR